MSVRNIIEIDGEKCDGCGQCVIGCAEGALEIIDGKARLVSEIYCDGLGACLNECPSGALTIVQRESDDFDEKAVQAHLAEKEPQLTPIMPQPEPLACGCPGSLVQELAPAPEQTGPAPASALGHWPVQLHLVPPKAPFLKKACLLIAATCGGFALPNLHQTFLKDRALIIACPKLDQTGPYEDKLIEILKINNVKSITVLYMTVPCCFGLIHLVRQALEKSGQSIPLRLVKVDVDGQIVEETAEQAA